MPNLLEVFTDKALKDELVRRGEAQPADEITRSVLATADVAVFQEIWRRIDVQQRRKIVYWALDQTDLAGDLDDTLWNAIDDKSRFTRGDDFRRECARLRDVLEELESMIYD